MKLYVNEKLFSFHRKFYVKDEKNIDDINKKEIVLAIIVAITNDVNRSQRSSN